MTRSSRFFGKARIKQKASLEAFNQAQKTFSISRYLISDDFSLSSSYREGNKKLIRKTRFGDWRLSPREKFTFQKERRVQSQIQSIPLELVPDLSHLHDLPQVQSLLEEDRKNSHETYTSRSLWRQAKLETLRSLFSTTLPLYRQQMYLALLRQQKKWVDALDLCLHGLWNKENIRTESSHALEVPTTPMKPISLSSITRPWDRKSLDPDVSPTDHHQAEQFAIVIALCPDTPPNAMWECYRVARWAKIPILAHTMLNLYRRCGQGKEQWEQAMRFMVHEIIKRQRSSYVGGGRRPYRQNLSPATFSSPTILYLPSDRLFAELIRALGMRRSSIFQVLDYVGKNHPSFRRSAAIWTAYVQSRTCSWYTCIQLYTHNFPRYAVDTDTALFNALIQRCEENEAYATARILHRIMKRKGVPQAVMGEHQ